MMEPFIRDGCCLEEWRVPLGEGYSGITIQNGRAFTMERQGNDEFVLALDAVNGKILWRKRTGIAPDDVYGGLGPRGTPAVDGDLVFVLGAQGDLLALQTTDGQLAWKRALKADFGWRAPAEGTSSSPLVHQRRIYIIVGSAGGKAFAALDRNTGKTLWNSQEDRTSYSSPVFWKLHDVPQVLFLSGSNLFAVNAQNGNLLWKYPWATYDSVNVATPIVIPPDRIFISAGYDQGAAMLRVKADDGKLQVNEVWRNREMKNHFNNSVYHQSTIYGFDNAILKAIDAGTGHTLWREKGFGTGSIVRSGNHLLILSDSGKLMIAEADRQRLNITATFEALRGKSWTPPSLAQGKIFLRNQSEIVCLAPKQRAPKESGG